MQEKLQWIITGILLLVIAGLLINILISRQKLDDINNQLFEQQAQFEQLEEGLARAESKIVTVHEFNQELKKCFSSELATIQSDLAELEAQPTVIHTTETIVKGSKQVIEDTNFPNSYLFRTDKGMPVAEYDYRGRTFKATTFDLSVKSNVLISETRAGNKVAHVKGIISSSGEDKEYPLDIVNSELTFIRPDKPTLMFVPHIDVGISAGYNLEHKQVLSSAAIGFSLLSLGYTKNDDFMRFLHLRGQVNEQGPGIGIDPVTYNIGDPIPIVSDIWIGAGPTYTIRGWEITASIASTF